jgi:hypothetical protein
VSQAHSGRARLPNRITSFRRSELWLPRPDPLFLCCRNKGVDALAVGQGNDPIIGFGVDACRCKEGCRVRSEADDLQVTERIAQPIDCSRLRREPLRTLGRKAKGCGIEKDGRPRGERVIGCKPSVVSGSDATDF